MIKFFLPSTGHQNCLDKSQLNSTIRLRVIFGYLGMESPYVFNENERIMSILLVVTSESALCGKYFSCYEDLIPVK